MGTIVQKNDPILRAKAQIVPLTEIGSPKIKKILSQMSKALAGCDDGVALAAPQINIPLKIFIVAGKIFAEEKEPIPPDLVFINPQITKLSKKKVILDEGCLSVRWQYGKIKRAEKATVEAYDELGRKFSYSASGLLAQIFQHEIDHLEGILFIDNATDLQEIPPDKQKK